MKVEEGYKFWRGIDSSFQNWLKEFDKVWHEHSKISKTFILIGSFLLRKAYIVGAKISIL